MDNAFSNVCFVVAEFTDRTEEQAAGRVVPNMAISGKPGDRHIKKWSESGIGGGQTYRGDRSRYKRHLMECFASDARIRFRLQPFPKVVAMKVIPDVGPCRNTGKVASSGDVGRFVFVCVHRRTRKLFSLRHLLLRRKVGTTQHCFALTFALFPDQADGAPS